MTRDAHEAPHSLGDDVVAGPVMVAAVAAEAADCPVDQPGIELFQFLIAQPHPVHDPGAEVLYEDVGLFHQLPQDILTCLLLHVQGHAVFIPVQVGIVQALAV